MHDGTVLLVGKDRVQGYRLKDGQPAWDPQTLPADGMPSGRGFLRGKEYYLPTTAEQLVRIDVLSGELLEPIKTRGVLGNLVCSKEGVFSQGVNRLTRLGPVEPQRE